jgi:hypothetical protein
LAGHFHSLDHLPGADAEPSYICRTVQDTAQHLESLLNVGIIYHSVAIEIAWIRLCARWHARE